MSVVTGMVHAVNGLYVTPKASECMFERHRLERIEGKSSDSVSRFEKDKARPGLGTSSLVARI